MPALDSWPTCWCPSTAITCHFTRQSQIYARDGLELDRATLADWGGAASALLAPLLGALEDYVMAAHKLHADDTPIPVLAPGTGKTRTGRLWAYVRDDRPAGSTDPPAVLFRYSPDRKGERPRTHLEHFRGILQADAYGGFNGLYDREHEPLIEAACWAHARRKFFDVHAATASPVALVDGGQKPRNSGGGGARLPRQCSRPAPDAPTRERCHRNTERLSNQEFVLQ